MIAMIKNVDSCLPQLCISVQFSDCFHVFVLSPLGLVYWLVESHCIANEVGLRCPV